jgi:hypothetical protein
MQRVVAKPWLAAFDPEVQERLDSPVITQLRVEPRAAPPGGRMIIRLQIHDRQGRGDIDPVLYQIREGIERIRTPLYDDGTHGDAHPSDGFYSGEMQVPPTAAEGSHWFVVFVYDRAGHRSNLELYEFTVLGEERKRAAIHPMVRSLTHQG